MTTILLAKSFVYDTLNTDHVTAHGTNIAIQAILNGTFQLADGSFQGIRIVDFMIDRDEVVQEVQLTIDGYGLFFHPQRSYPNPTTIGNAITFRFPVPQKVSSGLEEPGYTWTANHVSVVDPGTPPYPLRVTVQRKSN